MKHSIFCFLANWPNNEISASQVERCTNNDPRSACFYARRTTEQIVEWIYEHDNTLKRPYESSLSNLIHAYELLYSLNPLRA